MRLFQCRLRQGSTITIAWIEARGARRGARVGIADLGGFWHVEAVYPHSVSQAWLRQKQGFDRQGMGDI